MASSEAKETKCIITGLLTSNPLRCTIKQLCNDFVNTVGYKIPIRQLGFATVEDYLRSIPDTVIIYGSGPFAEVEGVIKPKSAHIVEMVARQKKPSLPKHKRHQIKRPPRRRSGFAYCPPANPSPEKPPSSYSPQPTTSGSNTASPLNCSSCDGVDEKEHASVDGDSSPSVEEVGYQSKIPPKIQNNLRKLILQHPDGVLCTQLPTEYFKMFKRDLSYERYGYRSLIEMCSDLPEVFHYVQPTSDDFILYDKNKPVPSLNQNEIVTPLQETIATTTILNEIPKIHWGLGAALIPSDVLYPGDRIPRYSIDDDLELGDYLDISVGEIYDISKFWLYLTFGDLKSLMSELQPFFTNQRNKYLIPESLLEEGLYCTCLYVGEFHRAVIVDLLPKLNGFVRVLFIDYGTVGNVRSQEIWYLPKQFATVPCQAIRARLSKIYPVYENRPWSVSAINRFRALTTNTALVAEITKINREDNFLEIYLADITDENHIFYINDVLVTEGHALYCDQERKPTLVDPNCKPNVQYIHLFPEFYEIESGNAPTTEEMNYIIANKVPMHHYMPQYFDINYKEDVEYIQARYEECNKVVPNFKAKPADVSTDFDYSFFPAEMQEEMRELMKQEEELKSRNDRPKPLCETSVKVECDDLIRGDDDKSVCSRGSSMTELHSTASVLTGESLNNSLNRLSLKNSEISVNSNITPSRSTNPFLAEDFVPDTNPFRISTNSVGSDINTSDLYAIFSKSSEEQRPEKIVNNLNPSPTESCTCKLNKQTNVEKSPLNNRSPTNPFKGGTNQRSRRVRTPPGFASLPQSSPVCYESLPPNFLPNPYYQRYPQPAPYVMPGQNQFNFAMPLANPGLNCLGFMPSFQPNQFQFNLQFLQQALAAQNYNPQVFGPRNSPNYGRR